MLSPIHCLVCDMMLSFKVYLKTLGSHVLILHKGGTWYKTDEMESEAIKAAQWENPELSPQEEEITSGKSMLWV